MKRVENYNQYIYIYIYIYINFWKHIKKWRKFIKFVDIEIQKNPFRQHKGSISIKNIDINKIVLSNRVSFGKKDLNISLATKMIKKFDLYVYFSQKSVHIEETLMKLNIYLF